MKYVDIRQSIPRHTSRQWKKRRKPPSWLVLHCLGTDNQDPNKTARYHVNPNHISRRGCPGIAYHDFIDKYGTIYRCNDYTDITWHAKGLNGKSLGVVLGYDGGDTPPPIPQLISYEQHLANLCLSWVISPMKVIGHREVPFRFNLYGKGSRRYHKECPGFQIDLPGLRTTLTIRIQSLLYKDGFYNGAPGEPPITGTYNKYLLKAMKQYAISKT